MPGLAETITSPANPRVKDAVKLRQRSHRDRCGLMLIEGAMELGRAIARGHHPTQLFTCPELVKTPEARSLVTRCREGDGAVITCSRRVFEKLVYRGASDGLLAVAPRISLGLDDLKPHDRMLLVVAEAVEKPGNLGTILRSADGAGADAVIVCDRCTDVSNPNVVRASLGAVFTVPVVEASSDDVLAWLGKHRVSLLAATPGARPIYSDVDMQGSVAIAVGAEKPGLTDRWLSAADICVRIPMHGAADSLNVGASTTILLYEALRQRSSRPS